MNDLSWCGVEINRLMLNEYYHEVTIIWNIIVCRGHWVMIDVLNYMCVIVVD